jgi:hypothetical protein
MATITVYGFEIFDDDSNSWIRARTKATRRAIEAAQGRIILDSGEEVDIETVNEDGVVVRRRKADLPRDA